MSALWHRYLTLLARRPLTTKCVTSGCIMMAGDAIQQGLEYRARPKLALSVDRAAAADAAVAAASSAATPARSSSPARSSAASSASPSFFSSYDVPRTVRSGIFGALAVGPLFHVWFRALDRWIPGSTLKPVAQKLLLDQGLMAPVFTTFYFCAMGTMEGCSSGQIREKIRTGLGPTLAANYAIFPLAQGVNFMFVPPELRVLVLNAGGLVYNVFLSRYNAAVTADSHVEEEGEQRRTMKQQAV